MIARRTSPLTAFVSFSLLLNGCAELAEHRLRLPDEGPPQPAPALAISNPPATGPTVAPFGEGQRSIAARMPIQAEGSPIAGSGQVVPVKGETPQASALRILYENAVEQHQTMASYIMRLRRREAVGGKARPEELILVKFRQEPWSVYFKWLGPEAKGREVVYVKGRPGNEIHTLTAAGDVPLLPAGQRFSVSADSPLVKARSRYPITEAGLGSTIHKFGLLLDAVEKGDFRHGTLKYAGREKRPEFDDSLDVAEQIVPPHTEALLPGGGRRWWFFDTTRGLPVLIVTQDEKGREVEYYCHDRIETPVHLDDDDFNPDKLWKKKAE
jgi:hypothetical protein